MPNSDSNELDPSHGVKMVQFHQNSYSFGIYKLRIQKGIYNLEYNCCMARVVRDIIFIGITSISYQSSLGLLFGQLCQGWFWKGYMLFSGGKYSWYHHCFSIQNWGINCFSNWMSLNSFQFKLETNFLWVHENEIGFWRIQ